MALPVTISNVATCAAPRRFGPWISSAGNVYVVLLNSGDASLIEVYKATDPTSSFSEVDSADGPNLTNVVLAYSAVQVSDVLHIVAQEGVTGRVSYHTFNMATDQWSVVNEQIVATTTVVDPAAVDIMVRSDGDVIVCYRGTSEPITMSSWKRVDYARREGGSWTADIAVDNGGEADWIVGCVVPGASDRSHFYLLNDTIDDGYQRTLTSANALETFPSAFETGMQGATTRIDIGAGTSYVSGGTTKVRVPYMTNAAGQRMAKCDSADAPTVTTEQYSTTTCQRLVNFYLMMAVAKGTDLHALFVSATDDDLYYDVNANDAGWGTDTATFTGAGVVRTFSVNIFVRGGNYKRAQVIDDAGTIKYDEDDLGSAITSLNVDKFDALTLTEFAKAVVPILSAQPVDILTATPEATPQLSDTRLVTGREDTISVTEQLQFGLGHRFFDAIVLVEDAIAQLRAGDINVNTFDALTLAELLKVALDLGTRPFDTLTITDESDSSLHLGTRPADTLSVQDVVQLLTVLGSRPADDIAVTDVLALVLGLGVRADEALSLAELVTAAIDLGVQPADLVTLSDEITAITHLGTRPVETTTIAELATIILHLGIRPQETVSVADVITLLMHLGVRPIDAMTVAAVAKVALDLGVRPVSVLNVQESVEGVVADVGALNTLRSDNIVIAEFLTTAMSRLVAHYGEDVALAEVLFGTVDLGIRPVDAISIDETAKAVVDLAAQRTDSLTVIELLQAAFDLGVRPIDVLTVVEAVTAAMDLGVKPAEIVSLLESALVAIQLGTRPEESASLVESLLLALDLGIRPFNTVSAVDGITVVVSPLVTAEYDAISITEAVAAALDLGIRADDLVSIDEMPLASIAEDTIFLQYTESVSITDTVRSALQFGIRPRDLLLLTEAVSTALALAWIGVAFKRESFSDASVSNEAASHATVSNGAFSTAHFDDEVTV